jgi:hypothetical protein
VIDNNMVLLVPVSDYDGLLRIRADYNTIVVPNNDETFGFIYILILTFERAAALQLVLFRIVNHNQHSKE